MPHNLKKKYPDLLDFVGLDEKSIKASLLLIFKRDIEDNTDFKLRGTRIYPIKSEGAIDMERTFLHLTTCEVETFDENGNKHPNKRVFDTDRSIRLHWINHHVKEKTPQNIEIFSVIERDQNKREDVAKTYIYDKVEKYVIIFECQRNKGYYLLSAYHLNKQWAEKAIKKKMKKKLPNIV